MNTLSFSLAAHFEKQNEIIDTFSTGESIAEPRQLNMQIDIAT